MDQCVNGGLVQLTLTEGGMTRREGLMAQTLAADVLVWTQGRFDSRAHLRASLPGTVLREGKLLYAA